MSFTENVVCCSFREYVIDKGLRRSVVLKLLANFYIYERHCYFKFIKHDVEHTVIMHFILLL